MDFLDAVKLKIKEFVCECDTKVVNELFTHLHTGKMLRSKLVQKIAGENEQTIKLCAVIEMIHAASLLHDDVIDDADTRRGNPSVNAIYDNKTAIMFGDILYSKGFSKLLEFEAKIAKKVADAVTLLSIGELLDVELSKDFNTNYDAYLDMIYKKTASLIEASAYSAAVLANKDENAYGLYGKNLGLAFQMVDDILDITSDSATLGKPAMHDFVEGKVTIPYLKMYAALSHDDKNKLKSLHKKSLNDEELAWLKSKFEQTNAVNESILQAKEVGLSGIMAIKSDNNESLVNIMKQMIERDF